MYGGYEITSEYYDAVNAHVDYVAWAEFLSRAIGKYSFGTPELVLDLGCGTGAVTIELAKLGYDMTGVDISPEMLDRARENADNAGTRDILWLCQDMRSFELYGTVDAVTACCDAVNYLLTAQDIDKCFSLVHNYLIPDGIFVFDISTRGKFSRLYTHDIVIDGGDMYCGWQNEYNEKTGIARFFLSYFVNEDGEWRRYDEFQRQRAWSVRGILSALKRNGFEALLVTDGYGMKPLTRGGEYDCDRVYFIARVKKTEKSGNNGTEVL